MRDFEYQCPRSLAAAVALFAEHNGSARPLAGGTDLIDHIRAERLTPDVVIDIKRIPELNVLECSDQGLRLGAAVCCRRICATEEIYRHYTALHDSCSIIGGIQIQNRASVGGNICNAGPAADSTPSLIALDAVCVIAGPNGPREVPAESFCVSKGQTVLERGELLVELRFPARSPRSGSHYRRFIPRNEMDIAVVGVGASVTLDEAGTTILDARIALGAVAAAPFFAAPVSQALIDQPATDETYAAAGEVARQMISPITDMRGTREFRLHVTGVLVERVVREAVARAAAT
ncbi:MAG: xanthine dehydrogenase family protein subunit M [Planctomycetaceae bacterium]|nr:xanthine dehydrogenase family protein subunit M [Planctomycetaceae bacterium]